MNAHGRLARHAGFYRLMDRHCVQQLVAVNAMSGTAAIDSSPQGADQRILRICDFRVHSDVSGFLFAINRPVGRLHARAATCDQRCSASEGGNHARPTSANLGGFHRFCVFAPLREKRIGKVQSVRCSRRRFTPRAPSSAGCARSSRMRRSVCIPPRNLHRAGSKFFSPRMRSTHCSVFN